MMSPRLPYSRTNAPQARTRVRGRGVRLATAACVASIALATAATPLVQAAGSTKEREASRSWNTFFAEQRPVAVANPRHVVVTFADPSLGEWEAAGVERLTPAQRSAWLKRAVVLQQKRIDALASAGVQFQIEHRYVRVVNGVSIIVHGDGAQLLRSVAGVASVAPVRTVWPTALGASAEQAADAAAATTAAASPLAAGGITVGVLDTGILATHPAVAGRVTAGFDATLADGAKHDAPILGEEHGTAVAGTVLRAAGADAKVQVVPVRVLASRPSRDGVESVLGDSDDVLAGLEHVVDPNGDGDTADALDVALIASTTPYAGFTDSAEERAVRAASALGTVVVAAAGNDGASGDSVGTVGTFAAAREALAVGAVDLRGTTSAADLHVRGGGIDETIDGAPLLTAASTKLPSGELRVVAIEGAGAEVVDYLDAELRSRVVGSVVVLAARDGVTVGEQVRAAADAGAIAVIIGARGASAAAGTIDVPGADIPAIGVTAAQARDLGEALDGKTKVSIQLTATTEANPAFGRVAGFGSGGPRLDGIGRPDLLGPGVGMSVAAIDSTDAARVWRTANGTSIAAAWVAGEVASLRATHPTWDPATIRVAVLGTAIPLGSVGERPPVSVQGAGVLDADRAAAVTWLSASGRIDFGTIAPGSGARRALALQQLGVDRAAATPKILLDDGGSGAKVIPSLDGGELTIDIPKGTAAGHVGGWLVLPDHDIRIPWTVTVRDAATSEVPISTKLSAAVLKPVSGPGAFASTLDVGIGGASTGGSLGLGAVQRLEVRLFDASGQDHGLIGGLDQALPGVYSFGLTGIGPNGKRLGAGTWQLRVRYVPAADPVGEWRVGPIESITVAPAAK
ncbi:MAG: minor extracellular protease VpR [Thermoleophilia bacterium]|nr:minor extracellular protease VpR [Thermoleophilia bacterium]